MWRVLLFLFLLPVEIYAALPPPIQHNAWTTNVSPNDRISGDATTPGGSSLALTLKNTGTAGQYTKTTFDAQGRETSGTTLSASDIPDLSGTYILSLAGQGTNTTIKSNLTVNVSSKELFTLHGTSGGPGLAFDFQQSLVRASNSVTLDTIWFNNGLQLGNTFGAPTIQLATDIGRVTATSFSGDGSLLTALNASQNTSGTLPAGRLPALTGAITTSAGSAATSLGSFSSANLATALTDETGSGSAVFGTAPTIAGGSITALTTFGLRDTSAAFDLTLAAVSGTALTAGRTLTLDVGNAAHTLVLGSASTLTFPTGTKTIPATADNLSVFAATTSAQLAGVLSDESGNAGVFPRFSLTSLTAGDKIAWDGNAWTNGASAGGSQTPWTSDINAAQYSLTNVIAITGTNNGGANRANSFVSNSPNAFLFFGGTNKTGLDNGYFHSTNVMEYWQNGILAFNIATNGDIGTDGALNVRGGNGSPDTNLTVLGNINSTGGQFNGNGAGLTNFSGGGRLTNVYIFTSTGTWTKPATLYGIDVEIIAGGGGGGAATNNGNSEAYGSGGSGGGYARRWIPASVCTNATETVTVGAAGTGGTAAGAGAGATGVNGGNTSFGTSSGNTPLYFSATGGTGGTGRTNTAASNTAIAGVAGGTASGGDINIGGGMSQPQWVSAAFYAQGGGGGSSQMGQGGVATAYLVVNGSPLAGNAATGYGGGGSGAASGNSSSSGAAGGNGSAGVVIVREYVK